MAYEQIETVANRVSVISASSTNSQYPTAKAVYDLLGGDSSNPVITTNNHKYNLLNGVANLKLDDGSLDEVTQTQLLHVTDIHNDTDSLTKAVALANYFPSISGIVITGDFVSSSYSRTQLESMTAILNTCTKPWYPVIGNHDVSGNSTIGELYQYLIYPAKTHLADSNGIVFPEGADNPTYYYADIGNIRLIVLDEFDNEPERGQTSGAAHTAMTQEQLEWFVEVLNDTPSTKGVVVAKHCPVIGKSSSQVYQHMTIESSKLFCANDTYGSSWANTYMWWSHMCHKVNNDYYYTTLGDIIHAFKNHSSGSLNIEIWNHVNEIVDSFTLDYNFTDAAAPFIGWLGGHNHRDLILSYLGQYQILPVCSSSNSTQMQWADMPKDEVQTTNIAFTVETFHNNTTIKGMDLIRLGSDSGITNPTYAFVTRDYERISS